MGLDMYLYGKRYLWKYPEEHPDNKISNDIQQMFPEIKGTDKRVQYVEIAVGDWRKANAIHKWFVDNVQEGNDNCRDYGVSREDLQKLLELCKKVVKIAKTKEGKVANGYTIGKKGEKVYQYEKGLTITNKKAVAKLLPTQEGFFFGNTDYDRYYLENVKNTISIIEECLKLPDEWDFEYGSSW